MIEMEYMSRSLRESESVLNSAENILFLESSVYRGPLKSFEPYRAKNIFSNDTSGNDPALVEATNDFYKAHDMLNSQLDKDGLTHVNIPDGVEAGDLGEYLRKVPTKYSGLSILLPLGEMVKALYSPEEDKMVVNKRIIPGTKEFRHSENLAEYGIKMAKEYLAEPVKKKVIPYLQNRRDEIKNLYKAKWNLIKTTVHELIHKKQTETGVIGSLLRKYGKFKNNLSKYIRNIAERHGIRYTSRTAGERTGEGEYRFLETQAIRGEIKNNKGPQNIFQKAESSPREGADLAERVYGLPLSRN